jgi:hypothetical protein
MTTKNSQLSPTSAQRTNGNGWRQLLLLGVDDKTRDIEGIPIEMLQKEKQEYIDAIQDGVRPLHNTAEKAKNTENLRWFAPITSESSRIAASGSGKQVFH